jgi:hypothetical protein
MLITPNEFRPANSLWSTPEQENLRKISFNKLVEDLRKISELKGETIFSKEAQQEFDKWYHPFRNIHIKQMDKSGIAGRIHTSIKKLSIIIAANDLSLEVKRQHMSRAIDDSIALLPNYDNLVISTGKSDIAEAGATIIGDLLESEGFMMTRRDIINRHWQDIGNSENVDKLLTTLEHGGIIEIVAYKTDKITYRLSNKVIERLKKENAQNKT